MGSSQSESERGVKLLASALELVARNARSQKEWADHLQSFVFERRTEECIFDVDGSESRWASIGNNPRHIVSDAQATDYQYPHCTRRVVAELLNPPVGTTLLELCEQVKTGRRILDRPIVEVFSERFPHEQEKNEIIALCGQPSPRFWGEDAPRDDHLYFPCIILKPNRVHFVPMWTGYRCNADTKILVARSVETL